MRGRVNLARGKPLVSVIIPTLPQRQTLYRAISSVLRQTFLDVEILFDSGGKNVQDARNLMAKEAQGKYLAFLDDDDEFRPDKLRKQVEVMESNPHIGLCITWGTDTRFGLTHLYTPKKYWSFKELLAGFNLTCTSAYMIRRDVFNRIGKMDDTLVDSHEYDLALRVSRDKEASIVYCIQEDLTKFNEAGDNWSYDYGRKITGMIQFVNKWGKYFTIKRWVNTSMCFVLFTIAIAWKAPIEKIFTLMKMKMERIGTLDNPTLIERCKV